MGKAERGFSRSWSEATDHLQVDPWLLIEQPLFKGMVMTNFSKYSRRLLIAAGLVVSASGAFAQSSNSANANATANVIRPITIASSRDLAFGNVVPGAALGTLVISSAGAQSVTGGVTQPGGQKGTVTTAQFDVAGEGSFTYTITLPGSPVTISDLALDTMTVGTFTSSIATTAGAGTLSGTAGNPGTQSFFVGGTLNVGANQAAGSYTGVFSVTVAYN